VIDDEIHEWILAASAVTPYLTLIADTCFSGGLARDRRPSEKWVEPDRRPTTTGRRRARSGTGSRSSKDKGPSGTANATRCWRLAGSGRAPKS
jgi:hypothetical protein